MQARFRIEALRAARRFAAALVLALCLMGCLQDGQGAPPLAGPSALALSIRLSRKFQRAI